MKVLAFGFVLFFIQLLKCEEIEPADWLSPCAQDNRTCYEELTKLTLMASINRQKGFADRDFDLITKYYIPSEVAQGVIFHLTNVYISNLKNMVISNVKSNPDSTLEFDVEVDIQATANCAMEFSSGCRNVAVGDIMLACYTNKLTVAVKFAVEVVPDDDGVTYINILEETCECSSSEEPVVPLYPPWTQIRKDPILYCMDPDIFQFYYDMGWKRQVTCDIASAAVSEMLSHYRQCVKALPATRFYTILEDDGTSMISTS